MHKMELTKKRQNRIMTDKGFSLIEVLVCIALIALVSVPLFSGLRVSATLNSNAHHTQKVTAYVQEELEMIKSISVEKYVSDFGVGSANVIDGVSYTYIDSGADWDVLNTRAQDIKASFTAPAGMTTAEEDALFKPFICEKRNLDIGGRDYVMHVKFMPAEYSQYDKNTAANVNVAGFYDIAEADAVRFPVIADEINLYDETVTDSILVKLDELDVDGISDGDILANMKKQVLVKAEVIGDEVEVRCDVTYSYPANSPIAEVNYCVYKSSYEIYPSSGAEMGSESGGKAFVFARAFRSSSNECINNLVIESTGDTDIYFILGSQAGADKYYNFNNITVNGVVYTENYNVRSALVPGEMAIAGTNGMFFCNIKENGMFFDLDTEEKHETIGRESYKAVGYAVEIDVYNQNDLSEKVAHLEATKIDR